MKIIADDNIPFLKGVLEPYAEVSYFPASMITSQTIKDADALIVRSRTRCDRNLLEGSSVRFIATTTIGFDHISTEYCDLKGINWVNAPGCNSGSVMQYVAAALTHLSEKYQFVFKNKTIGIVGVGNVGSKVARLASVLGMKVLLNDPPRERKEGKKGFVSLEKMIKNSDIITFHVPLNKSGIDKTWHFFDKKFFEQIKPGTMIINTSRGEVLRSSVLKNGLRSKKIRAAVIDVWENEPDIDLELLNLVDIGTPHVAGYAVDGKANATAMAVQSVSRFFGMGLNNWFPKNIPQVTNPFIELDCQGMSLQKITNQTILATYDIQQDDEKLRNKPKGFEKFRDDYPVRREFGAYRVALQNDSGKAGTILKKIGFRTDG